MEFKGLYFSKSIPSGKQESHIDFGKQLIDLRGEDHHEQWNTAEIDIEIGGSNNHLIFFTPKNNQENSFYIFKDRDLIEFLSTFDNAQWSQTLLKHNKEKNKFNYIFLGIILIFCALIYSLFASRGFLAQKVVNSIPYKVEKTIGRKLLGTVLPPEQVYQDEKLLNELKKLLQPLIEVTPKEYQDFKIYISKSEDLNAFATPGGQIIFNIGALKAAKSPLEILGVAAHEMAHVTQRHVLRNLIQALGVFGLFQVLLGDITGIIAVLGDQGSFLLMKGFSRSMETDADEKGFEYLLNAGINPLGLAGFFKLIKKEMKDSGVAGDVMETVDKHLNFLSTHPGTDERIKEIEQKYEQLPRHTKRGFRDKYPAFEEIKRLLNEKDNK